MKTDDVKVGAVYEARVSKQLVPVRVFKRLRTLRYQFSRSGLGKYVTITVFWVVNLRTGREIAMRASRLRRELMDGGASE